MDDADARNVLWLIGIASLWTFGIVMAFALCAMARRGDEALTLAFDEPVAAEDVAWIATLAAPVPAPITPAPLFSAGRRSSSS